MRTFGDFIFYFFIGMCILVFLAGCASGPSAEPTACRGAAFSINPPSSFAPTATDQTAGVQ